MEDMASRETVISHLKKVPDEALDEILDSRGLERSAARVMSCSCHVVIGRFGRLSQTAFDRVRARVCRFIGC